MVFLVRYEHCIFGFRCPLVVCSNCRHASINESLGEASMRRGLLCCTLFDGLQPLQTKTYIFPSALCVSFGRSLNVGLALRLRTFHSNLGIPLSPEVDFLYIAITNNDSCPYIEAFDTSQNVPLPSLTSTHSTAAKHAFRHRHSLGHNLPMTTSKSSKSPAPAN